MIFRRGWLLFVIPAMIVCLVIATTYAEEEKEQTNCEMGQMPDGISCDDLKDVIKMLRILAGYNDEEG